MKTLVLTMGLIVSTAIIFQNCGSSFESREIASLGGSVFSSGALGSNPPNIIMIMLDDAGQGDWMDPKIAPNINSFRNSATLFPSFYVTPMCAPTRVSMLSGRSPVDYSLLWVCGSNAIYGIPNSDPTLPQSLEDRGYFTATFGKWHASSGNPEKTEKLYPPSKQYAIGEKFTHYVKGPSVMGKGYFSPKMIKNGKEIKHKSGHLTDITRSYVEKYINYFKNRKNKKPFYFQYWLNAPHAPQTPDPRMIKDKKLRAEYKEYLHAVKTKTRSSWRNSFREKHQRMLHELLLKQADENIGKLLKLFNTNDPYLKNTVIMITSDNGGTEKMRPKSSPGGNLDYLGRHLRGFKTDVFEGGIRQNLLVKMPNQNYKRVDNSVLSVTDIYPTILDLVGARPNAAEKKQMVGQSFEARLRTKQANFSRTDPLYWTFKVKNEHVDTTWGYAKMSWAIRKGKWKLVSEPLDGCSPCLFEFKDGYSNESPSNDVSENYPLLVKELREEYLEWYISRTRIPTSPAKRSSGVKYWTKKVPGFNGRNKVDEIVYQYNLTESNPKGWVQLHNSKKFEINRLDFTFSANITPRKINGKYQVIATRNKSWVFRLTALGELQLGTWDPDGRIHYYHTKERLQVGKSYDVGFTIYSFKSLNSVIKIFARDYGHDLDNEERLVEVRRGEVGKGVMSNQQTIYIGAHPNSNKYSFIGEIRDARFYHVPLKRAEIGYGMRWWGDKFK